MGVPPIVRNTFYHDALENSNLIKALSCVPVFGEFVSRMVQFSLQSEIAKSEILAETIELIQITNEYKSADIARRILSVVILIIGLALGALPGLQLLCIGIMIGTIAWSAHERNKNCELITELQTTGFRDGMRVR
ncbi:MAG: hypothetical protein V4487_05755 [Chlamydiota bacterium]